MNCFAFYRKVVALDLDVYRNLEFATHEVDFSFARDAADTLIAGVEFAEPALSANA